MRVTLTGATGLVGRRLVRELLGRGDEVTVLSRNPAKVPAVVPGAQAVGWDPMEGTAPAEALAGRDGVVHLAGENLAQRWDAESKRRINDSRELGTRNLVAGLRAADPRPGVLVSASAVGYYGPHGDEVVDEGAPAGNDFAARVCVNWERETAAAAELGMREVRIRIGLVLDKRGGALSKMLLPFRAGVGGPVAGGGQYFPWIHVDDVVAMFLMALDDPAWQGPVNATAPEPVTNKAFSRALGRALHRPAVAPIPGFAIKLLYGQMSEIVTTGQRAVPRRAQELGFVHAHPELEEALRAALR